MFYEIAVLKPEILKEIIDTYKHTHNSQAQNANSYHLKKFVPEKLRIQWQQKYHEKMHPQC